METYGKYAGVLAGLLLAASGFLPLMEQNGISVNGFRTDLGLQVGYWMLLAGGGIAGLSFVRGKWSRTLASILTMLAVFLFLITWWQGHKLQAAALGTWLMGLGAGLAIAAQILQLQRKSA